MENLARKNEELKLAVNELTVLNDIATTISSMQPVEKIIELVVTKCITHLRVEEATISLLERNERASQFHTMIRRQDSSVGKLPIKLDKQLKGWMIKHRKTLFSNNIREDERFRHIPEEQLMFRSIICVPLMVKGGLIGYLAVFNKKNGEDFTEEDRRLLTIIGSQSAQVIENARLYEEEKALISLQEEMRMAHEIQLSLLPDRAPSISGFEIAAHSLPAKSVGGDYYDFITLNDNRLGFCVGDITGKGMPAAMLMANLQATLRTQVMIFEDCCQCMKGTNKQLFRNTESTKFATLFYGILHPEEGILHYSNGGHDAPLLFRKSGREPEQLEATGLLLGVFDEVDYSVNNTPMEAGDLLVLYTDGITEAMNIEEEEFGLQRLIDVVEENRGASAGTVLESILDAVKRHAGKASQSDDITLMIVKRGA